MRPTRRCPFIDAPTKHCHVSKLDSGSVEKAIIYCGGIYEECTIYISLVWKLHREENDAEADAPKSHDRPLEAERARGKKQT